MIYGTLAHIEDYQGIHPRIMRGLELLRDTDFSALPDGRYEIEGSDLFYMLQSYETVPGKDTLEAHRLYADIFLMLSGRELLGVAPLETLGEPVEDPEGDIKFYKGPFAALPLEDDRFAVLFPGDAHAPAIADGAAMHCRKCVVKVRL